MPDAASADLPPIDGRLRRIANTLYPRIMRLREHVTDVRFANDDNAKRLVTLKGKRVLFLPNHPSVTEPPVMYGLSVLLDEPFRFAAMDELFVGTIGAIVARLGAFPIKRGTPDRQALKRCQASLLAPAGKLVLFAEGEAHGQNDQLLPLNPGAAQVAFWTMDKLREQEGDSAELMIVPVAIKYQFENRADAYRQISEGLHHVEGELGLEAVPKASLYQRMRRAALTVLGGIESEYDLPHADTDTTDTRLTRLYEALEARVIAMLRIPAPKEETMVHRMRTLFNAAYAYREKFEEGETPYAKRLQERREWIADACLADLRRVENFIGVRDGRIEQTATLEQLGEMLARLEVETHGDRRTHPLRTATVKLAEPIAMSARTEGYKAAKREAVAALMGDVETQIKGMLTEMRGIATPATKPE